MEQDPHLPFFAHYISINAVRAPAEPCGECLLFYPLPPSMIASLTSGPVHPFSQSPLVLGCYFPGPLPLRAVAPWSRPSPSVWTVRLRNLEKQWLIIWHGGEKVGELGGGNRCNVCQTRRILGHVISCCPGRKGPVPIPQVGNRF